LSSGGLGGAIFFNEKSSLIDGFCGLIEVDVILFFFAISMIFIVSYFVSVEQYSS
jgi:hypothetical protein